MRLAVNHDPRILICRVSAIGDCILTMPMLCALRDSFPRAYIAWIVERAAAPLLKDHACLDQLIVVNKGWLKSPREILNLRRQLRELRFDVAIDPQSLTKSSFAAFLSGARDRIGFAKPRGRELSVWLNSQLIVQTATHLVDAQLQLLAPLGVTEPRVRFAVPRDEAAELAMHAALQTLHLGCPFAAINVGAGWDSRLWPTQQYGRVAKHLAEKHRLPSVVTWAGDRERAWAQEVVTYSGGNAFLAPPTTLTELTALLRRARIFIGSDTGPMHLAAAVGIPCIGLHGTTRPEESGAYGEKHQVVQARYQSGTARERRKASNDAMREISAEAVCAACDTSLAAGTNGHRQSAAA
jgi:heptosyltransferase-1